jgi:hypothetical protein
MPVDIQKINNSLAKTNKAIIALGDSFVEGQGAIDDDLYEKYNWHFEAPGYPLKILADDNTKARIVKEYPDLILENSQIMIFQMCARNAFVDVLANKYFMGEYTPINFGKAGGSNRGRVKQLYLHPQINWHLIKELIIIFMPTSLERFDFVEDTATTPGNWFKTVWPSLPKGHETSAMGKLWGAYSEAVFSDKAGMIESYLAVKELESWCQNKNAKLIITPAFDKRFEKSIMKSILRKTISRESNWLYKDESHYIHDNDAESLAEHWPWHLMFDPNGHFTMAHMCMMNEPDLSDKEEFYFQFQNKRSPLGWMTPCSHPGQKGHDLFARLVFEYLRGN